MSKELSKEKAYTTSYGMYKDRVALFYFICFFDESGHRQTLQEEGGGFLGRDGVWNRMNILPWHGNVGCMCAEIVLIVMIRVKLNGKANPYWGDFPSDFESFVLIGPIVQNSFIGG